MWSTTHDYLSREPRPIPPGYLSCWSTFVFAFFPLEVSETIIPFRLLCLAEQLVPCSAPVNVLARLRLFANTVPTAPFKLPSSLTPCKMSSPHHNEEPIERHNLTLAYTRVHVLYLCPRKALCFRSIFSSSTSTPLMRLGHFTKFHPSCSASRFALS
ncbi:hypothetical protein B296_00011750 [Ensete ventricosum]|uniref:Uncharacterized protein n=1 Tax=Ensete ventricosum TaxID=4639 RepID=A0A426YZB7_ENSVE|nr:hypothetical protein B296_00011750 [Ensete ventricosum]